MSSLFSILPLNSQCEHPLGFPPFKKSVAALPQVPLLSPDLG